jgi:hypothetical protein
MVEARNGCHCKATRQGVSLRQVVDFRNFYKSALGWERLVLNVRAILLRIRTKTASSSHLKTATISHS